MVFVTDRPYDEQDRDSGRRLRPMEEEDEEIVEMRDQGPHGEEHKNDQDRSSPLASFMFGEVSVFRDFFLAAFSDGYYGVCCSEEGFFPGSGADAEIETKTVEPPEETKITHRRSGSHSPSLMKSGSYGGDGKKKRKKPLAVAVGFNYANDANGRPIVITPGSPYRKPGSTTDSAGVRKSVDLTHSRSGRSSGSSVRSHATPPRGAAVPSSGASVAPFDEARDHATPPQAQSLQAREP